MSKKQFVPLSYGFVIVVAFVLFQWSRYEFDITRFIVAGTDYVAPEQTPVRVYTFPGNGYDGQFFFRYVISPFHSENPYRGVKVDAPHYRHTRIMYPLIVWLLSSWNEQLIPYMMVLVNVLAYLGLWYFMLRICGRWNLAFNWGLFVFFIPGLWMCLMRNLSELTEAAFFMVMLWSFLEGKRWQFSLAAFCMLLTRETSLIVLLPFILLMLRNKTKTGSKQKWIVSALLPVFLFLLYRFLFERVYGFYGTTAQAFEWFPLKGLWEATWQQHQLQGSWLNTLFSGWAIMLFFTVGIIAFAWYRAQFIYAGDDFIMQWLSGIALIWIVVMLILSQKVWVDYWAFCRAFTIPMLVSCLLFLRSRSILSVKT